MIPGEVYSKTCRRRRGEETVTYIPGRDCRSVCVCVHFFFFFFFAPSSSMLISKPDVMMMFMSYQTRKTNIEGSRGEEI